jgi:hypothetical protein
MGVNISVTNNLQGAQTLDVRTPAPVSDIVFAFVYKPDDPRRFHHTRT